MNSRVRHVDLRVFKIRELIENKQVVLEYCKSARMIADIGAKALPGPQFHELRLRLTGYARHEHKPKGLDCAAIKLSARGSVLPG